MRRWWPLLIAILPLGMTACFSMTLGVPGLEPTGTVTTASRMAMAAEEVITGVATGNPWEGILKAVGVLLGGTLIGGGAVVAKKRHDKKKAEANNTLKG